MRPGSERNNGINTAAFSLGTCVSYGLDLNATARALLHAATVNGHVAKHGEGQTKRSIESGLKSGMAKPRQPLADGDAPLIDLSRLLKPNAAPAARQTASKAISLTPMTDVRETPIRWLGIPFCPAP